MKYLLIILSILSFAACSSGGSGAAPAGDSSDSDLVYISGVEFNKKEMMYFSSALIGQEYFYDGIGGLSGISFRLRYSDIGGSINGIPSNTVQKHYDLDNDGEYDDAVGMISLALSTDGHVYLMNKNDGSVGNDYPDPLTIWFHKDMREIGKNWTTVLGQINYYNTTALINVATPNASDSAEFTKILVTVSGPGVAYTEQIFYSTTYVPEEYVVTGGPYGSGSFVRVSAPAISVN